MDQLMLGITAVSTVIAAVSAGVAWRVVDADRRRRAARVSALAAAAGVASQEERAAAPMTDMVPDGLPEFLPAREAAPAAPATAMFSAPVADSGSGHRQHGLLAAAALAGVVVAGGAAAMLLSGRGPGATTAPARPPLELLTLGHTRADGRLVVTGVVRNPAADTVSQVQADVRVFDAAGLLISSHKALVDLPVLASGQESPFTIPVGEASTAARYRVSFSSAGTVLSHVDRRSNLPAAVTADAR